MNFIEAVTMIHKMGRMDMKMENARLKKIGMVCQTLNFVFANQPIVMITNLVVV